MKLLSDAGSGDSAGFANELRERSAGLLGPDAGDPVELPGGELLPGDGKALPAELARALDELESLQQSMGADLAALEPDIDLVLEDLRLPAGLNLSTPIDSIEVSDIALSWRATPDATGDAIEGLPETALLAAGMSGGPAGTLAIEEVAEVTRLSVNQLEDALDRTASRLSADDLRAIADKLKAIATAAEQPARPEARTAAGIVPAGLVKLDGSLVEGRTERFRPLGVGAVPSATATALAEARGAIPQGNPVDELAAAMAETLRGEQTSLLKPQAGGYQVHATSAAAGQVASLAQQQPTSTGAGLVALSETIETPVRDASWGDRLGERVLLMATNRLQNAELRLSPADMGPLRVRLSIEENAANVSFVANASATREAIESALPRLRNLLEENGISLGQATVDEQSAEQQADEREAGPFAGESGVDGEKPSAEAETVSAATRVRVAKGLLDTFV